MVLGCFQMRYLLQPGISQSKCHQHSELFFKVFTSSKILSQRQSKDIFSVQLTSSLLSRNSKTESYTHTQITAQLSSKQGIMRTQLKKQDRNTTEYCIQTKGRQTDYMQMQKPTEKLKIHRHLAVVLSPSASLKDYLAHDRSLKKHL